ncbi:class I SAM-dependent methyltransferase [Psychrobacillus sp. NPDC096623]|uniref:class I SAM-dependent methyltransferase n=1 Tax=Psychrobacillus sp. NPDC096623 TaxID=3364492 RepID=UPI003817FF93
MKSNWVKPFYKRQFELYSPSHKVSEYDMSLSAEIMEQVGKPFRTILELGAGNGRLARALASFDKEVTTIELVPEIVEFTKQSNDDKVNSLCGSFYTIELEETFEVILYMDGFGIGTDNDQIMLLERIYNWLSEDGIGLIDIYQPKYWQKVNGIKMSPNLGVLREYGYDVQTNRMIDTWWAENSNDKVVQSLACYTPEEVIALCQRANLKVLEIYPGGAMDYDKWVFQENTTIDECLSYRIKIRKT